MNSQEYREEFNALAEYLQEGKEKILENWREGIMEKESQATALNALSQEDFYNSIPEYVDHLCLKFRNEENQLEKVSKSHGSHRWQFGFHLRNVVIEWEYLHVVLMEQINEAQKETGLSTETLIEAHYLLTTSIHRSIRYSVDEYYRSERQKAEVHMQDLQNVLREKDEFSIRRGQNLQQVSHDIGGSMSMLRLHISLLKRASLDDDVAEIVKMLSASADSLNELLSNLLKLFRLEADQETLEITDFDVAKLLRSLCANIKHLASEKGLEFRSSGDESLQIRSDRIKIQRVAQNLLLNSLKYTPKGFMEIQWKGISDSHWMLSVVDTGPGIESTNAAPFLRESEQDDTAIKETLDDPEPSKVQLHSEGIGLSIVRRLCDMLDAVVKIETEAGEGTHFQIVFPLVLSEKEDL